MSVDYFAKNLSVPSSAIDSIKKNICTQTKWRIVRDTGGSFGIVMMRGLNDTYMDEEATISITAAQIHVAFHSAEKEERKLLLDSIRETLSNLDIPCNFSHG